MGNKYIVYKTTNRLTSDFYLGVHKQKGDLFDGYLGSGTRLKNSISKYGKENFIRETLFSFNNPKEAYSKEKEIVNLNLLKNPKSLNLKVGGEGGFTWYKGKALFMNPTLDIDGNFKYPCHSTESRGKALKTTKKTYGEGLPFLRTPKSLEKAKRVKIEKYGSITGMLTTRESINKAKLSRKLKYETLGLKETHFMLSENAKKNSRKTRDLNALKKDPRLGEIIILYLGSKDIPIVTGSALEVLNHLYGSKSAVKKREFLFRVLDNKKSITVNKKSYIAVRSSTTSA